MPYQPSSQSQQYATTTDLQNNGMSAATLSHPNISSATVQNAHLLSASQTADSYLRQRYVLPLSQWGSDLVKYVCWLASYTLICLRGYNPASEADQVYKANHDTALAWLRDIARGLVSPDITGTQPNGAPGVSAPEAQPSVFTASPVNSTGSTTRGTSSR